MNPNPIFLDTAIKIANRIIDSAIWDGNSCTWNIFVTDTSMPNKKEGKWELASITLYHGVAGIGVFLCEIFRIQKDPVVKHTLLGAVNYCISEMKSNTNSFGFYGGNIGVAYFLTIAGIYLEDERLMKNAANIISPLKGHEHEDKGFDVISGAGGAIPALIKIHELTNNSDALEVSINLAENLINKAIKEPCGWSWGEKIHTNKIRNLCGFAHGSAGIGSAFLELFGLTKSNYYLYAAEQAFLYERNFYSEENNNWPDFRYVKLSDFTSYNRLKELRIYLQTNLLPPYTTKYMSAWCHGAPGIGLSRIRAYELTSNETYLIESQNACKAVTESLKATGGNYSLCHGHLGNAETLIEASVTLNENRYHEIAKQKAIEGIEQFEKKNIQWPCGTMGAISDPSLLVGEAGIGYFLLRLADKSTPSILSVKSNVTEKSIFENRDESTLRNEYINTYFGKTLGLLGKADKNRISESKQTQFEIGGKHSDVEKTYTEIGKYIESTPEKIKGKLADLFLIEKERYISIKLNDDFSKEYIEKLLIEENKTINWEKCRITLKPHCKLLKTKYNWDDIKIGEAFSLEDYREYEQYHILFKESNTFYLKNISLLSFTLFSLFIKESSLEEIIHEIKNVFDIGQDQIAHVIIVIKEQIKNAYMNNIVTIKE